MTTAELLQLEARERRMVALADLTLNTREWSCVGKWGITIDRREIAAVEGGHPLGSKVWLKGGSCVLVDATHGALVAWWRGAP